MNAIQCSQHLQSSVPDSVASASPAAADADSRSHGPDRECHRTVRHSANAPHHRFRHAPRRLADRQDGPADPRREPPKTVMGIPKGDAFHGVPPIRSIRRARRMGANTSWRNGSSVPLGRAGVQRAAALRPFGPMGSRGSGERPRESSADGSLQSDKNRQRKKRSVTVLASCTESASDCPRRCHCAS
jgi:hypothetical protein